jgi:hypothetical protein
MLNICDNLNIKVQMLFYTTENFIESNLLWAESYI